MTLRHWAWDFQNGWKPCTCPDCGEHQDIATPLHPSAIGREYDLLRIDMNRRWNEVTG